MHRSARLARRSCAPEIANVETKKIPNTVSKEWEMKPSWREEQQAPLVDVAIRHARVPTPLSQPLQNMRMKLLLIDHSNNDIYFLLPVRASIALRRCRVSMSFLVSMIQAMNNEGKKITQKQFFKF